MKNRRLAAIDIGTNSIRCIIVEADRQGKYKVLDDEKATVRLGEGMAACGAISDAAEFRAIDALDRMKKIIDGFGVTAIEAVATSAVRRAANGDAFVDRVADSIGLDIQVISGDEEAELAIASALHNFDMEGTHYAVADIGGGSVEIITAVGSHVEEIRSLEMGAVTLTDSFSASDPLRQKDYERMRKHIRKTLTAAFSGERTPVHCLIGSGGTMTTIASMVMAMRREGYGSIHGYEMLRSEVVHLLAMLLRKDLAERRTLPGLHPDRADIIVAGVALADELMTHFSTNLLRINERGVREGLIIKLLKRQGLFPPAPRPRNWRDGVLEFARSCHHDEEHALQVARLALELGSALEGKGGIDAKGLQLLEAAALVHDVGYFISYSAHHKHTYHLVRHADLFGFTPREREIIALVARYHRKSLPKKNHEGYARLSSEDRLLVKKLGGILRLADGLDRRRSGIVKAVDCSLSGTDFLIRLQSDGDVSVEMYGGKAKGDLFEAAFGKRLVLFPPNESTQQQ